MKQITFEMMNMYKLRQLGFDFMGYTFTRPRQLSFHHLIIPRRLNGEETIENGAILRRDTAHDYLHRIERVDLDCFNDITSEMIDENIKGYLDITNLRRIRDILEYFEREHCGDTSKRHKRLIKEEYIKDRIKI